MKTGIRLSCVPRKLFREISSLRIARVLSFATDNMDIQGKPRVEFTIK